MVDLGTLLPNNRAAGSEAYGINDRGQVMGWSSINPTDGYARAHPHAFLWDGGVMQDYGSPSPTSSGQGFVFGNINASGAFVGTLYASQLRAALWVDGTVRDLGTLGGPSASAAAINDRGQVVGTSALATEGEHAFLWENGVMSDLGTLGGRDSRALDINQGGQVAGQAQDAGGAWHAFLWDQGVMQDLGALGDRPSFFTALNDPGDVVFAGLVAVTPTPGFFWSHGALQELGTVSGSISMRLNNRGQVAGNDYPSGAFIWEGGVRTDLGHLPGGDNSLGLHLGEWPDVGPRDVSPPGRRTPGTKLRDRDQRAGGYRRLGRSAFRSPARGIVAAAGEPGPGGYDSRLRGIGSGAVSLTPTRWWRAASSSHRTRPDSRRAPR